MMLLPWHYKFNVTAANEQRFTAQRTDFFFAVCMMVSASLDSAAFASASSTIIFFLAEAKTSCQLTIASDLGTGTSFRRRNAFLAYCTTPPCSGTCDGCYCVHRNPPV